jgi:prophage regulatory protein
MKRTHSEKNNHSTETENHSNSQSTPDYLLTDKQVAKILNFSRSHLWAGVKVGKYPPPIKLSERVTRWKTSQIIALINKAGR